MKQKTKLITGILVILMLVIAWIVFSQRESGESLPGSGNQNQSTQLNGVTHPLQILQMRAKDYPGSEVTIEDELSPQESYKQYLTSYQSDGLKIYALLTVPQGDKPGGGWPAIIFNHGYIPPEQYQTLARYQAYVDVFARNGYIVFKPDYRGHGNSDGNPEGAYFSAAYTVDVLNAVSSIKKFGEANPDRIGMWGHSMGGSITLRSMVVTKDIKAGVIWAGVVASYDDMMNRWRRRVAWQPSERENMAHRPSRDDLIKQFGDFDANLQFWKSIAPISFVADISGPIQLHHGLADESVPPEFSESLKAALEAASKTVEYYTYDGADHNISGASFNLAMQRSVEFFDKYLK
ncbi:MAG: Dipeptidylaminopeptidase/acylaminoacyl-peptidase [Microgenomates group bacterium GW2011_GWC1_40_35]|nr:MAG: Dipeptidylaminopeptidase/acylaminoacyl-peptidase [Candidatus Curtissbacteria bacterium GW2011_GWB1_40_28]KKR58958.1 MAG: Dipeptidylaminopeptidase/acylaminoacyl-peptidase [Candidatus Curtissbacteria bacterium GW2011_GWA2_40_31]KKR59788.1 MAG: Dipeptidylaminopeptidase/acylaminoacyl-peptidase [Microgenomates group bacterium GW2011_GWC1_40_35]KKS01279.1 MAG: Dipeptidylaminopeptidase/acylaminoacyl-peptidase [Candidatus Curtissbacteria bacterium GW2011_GWC2_41_21]